MSIKVCGLNLQGLTEILILKSVNVNEKTC